MDSTRRKLILGTAGLAALPVAGLAANATARSGAPAHVLRRDGRMTVNRERAYRLMKAANIDAIVGATNINSRYLTNMHGIYADMGNPYSIIGVMPADPAKPIIAIIADKWDIGRHTQPDREWPEIVTYSSPQADDRFKGRSTLSLNEEVGTFSFPGAPMAADVTLSATERQWQQGISSRPTFNEANPVLALRRVLKELGLQRGNIAIDDANVSNALVRYGLSDAHLIDADNFFKNLRMVKSAVEIDRMRIAAKLNGEAIRAMFPLLHAGMRYEDVESIFFSEAAKRGGRPNVLGAGMVTGLRNGVLTKHEPVLIDGVASFDGYCGDFGRTVVIGAPSTKLEKRIAVIRQLVPATFELIKPGVSYSQLTAKGAEIVKKIGADFRVGVGPHSVGMEHSDDAYRDDMPFAARADTVLQAGMTITLDMPTIEPGWGATHMETLILVKEDGAEWLDGYNDALHEVA
jgi:Xaa-Pro aminopeptidase